MFKAQAFLLKMILKYSLRDIMQRTHRCDDVMIFYYTIFNH